jgi:hypothetical protein
LLFNAVASILPVGAKSLAYGRFLAFKSSKSASLNSLGPVSGAVYGFPTGAPSALFISDSMFAITSEGSRANSSFCSSYY